VASTRISSGIKLVALGAFAFAAQIACSDDPAQTPIIPPGNSSGTGNNTAGTPSSGGTFGSAGTPSNTSGTSFGTAGTPATGGTASVGGTGAGGTAGAGTAGTATAGSGGTGVVPNDPYCMGKTPEALPFSVSAAFYPSGWYPDGMQIETPADLGDACTTGRSPGAVGGCTPWRYKPAATASWAAVGWVTSDGKGFVHPPVCLPADATALTFLARGVKGGEKLSIGGLGVNPEKLIQLTNAWKRFSIPLAGVTYNSLESGVKSGFSWKVEPPAPPAMAEAVEFFIDDIQVVKGELPPDPSGGGGAGGGGAE
jgi:hypothetical protein